MELYHCLNRGVDKRAIVMGQNDRTRFVHELYAMNDNFPAGNSGHYLNMDLRSPYLRKRDRDRRHRLTLVDIHAWCLMGNHYHLLLSERQGGGLSKYLRKLNIGYAKYFNEKHERQGALFQGRTKKVLISNDTHFNHILHYIHANPLDLLDSAQKWRSGIVRNTHAAHSHLMKYKWSSYLDYVGEHNFPSLLTTSLFCDMFPDYRKAMLNFLKTKEHECDTILTLE